MEGRFGHIKRRALRPVAGLRVSPLGRLLPSGEKVRNIERVNPSGGDGRADSPIMGNSLSASRPDRTRQRGGGGYPLRGRERGVVSGNLVKFGTIAGIRSGKMKRVEIAGRHILLATVDGEPGAGGAAPMSGPGKAPQPDPAAEMRSIIKRIATGPELSKDISRDEAREGMSFVLDGRVDPVQAGVFLIALRMKRETDDENLGILDALRRATQAVTAPVDEVLQIGDPYDGFNRTLPASPFLPAVLAACGVASVSHGVERMGPKYGVTHRQVLQAAGVSVDLGPEQAAARLGEPELGWAYVDQEAFCPKLYRLAALRTLIVKRAALTTVEVMVCPLRGRVRSHLVTGYVHKAYPRIYALLARQAGFASALIVRGVEGGVTPSPRQAGKAFHYSDGGEERPWDFVPADFGVEKSLQGTQVPERLPKARLEGELAGERLDTAAAAKLAAEAGLDALKGQPGPARDDLVCSGALCLRHLERHGSLKDAANAVREALDSGRAHDRLQRAR